MIPYTIQPYCKAQDATGAYALWLAALFSRPQNKTFVNGEVWEGETEEEDADGETDD